MRARLAAALRALVDHAVTADVPVADTARIASDIARVDAELQSFPRRDARTPHLPDLNDLQYAFSGDPIIGTCNPIAPPVHVVVEGAVVRGSVRLGNPYEGPPGYVHGAVVA